MSAVDSLNTKIAGNEERRTALNAQVRAAEDALGQAVAKGDGESAVAAREALDRLEAEQRDLQLAQGALEGQRRTAEQEDARARRDELVRVYRARAKRQQALNDEAIGQLLDGIEKVRKARQSEDELAAIKAEIAYQSAVAEEQLPKLPEPGQFPTGKAAQIIGPLRGALMSDHFEGQRQDWVRKLSLLEKERRRLHS